MLPFLPDFLFRVSRFLLVFLCIAFAGLHAASTPTDVVSTLQDKLVHVIGKDAGLDYGERYRELQPVIESTHDLPRIAEAIMGKHWEELSVSERQLFIDRFSQFTIANYAAQFDSPEQLVFQNVSETALRGERMLVRAFMQQNGGAQVQFDYVLTQEAGQWRIVNVVVRGVSDLAVKRAEFASILQREGFEGLLARLDEKIRQYRSSHG